MSTTFRYTDRHGRALAPGLRVRVCHCVGPYGQTATFAGVLEGIDEYGGVRVKLSHAHVHSTSRQCTAYKAGDSFYVASVFGPPDAAKVIRGYRKHEDFEHGHEVWIEVIA